MKKFPLMAGVSVMALVLGADLAAAQEIDVTQRPRPEYDAPGIRAGSFLIFPKPQIIGTYDSNIYATENDETDDFITRLNPSVAVESDWNNHALNADAYINHAFYASNSDEDWTDYGIGFDGRIDVQRSAILFGGLGFDHLHEDRGDPNASVQSTEPTEYDRMGGNIGGTYKPNRLGLTAEGTWVDLDYDNGTTNTGALVNNDDRDRNEFVERLRVGYDIQPGYTLFAQGSMNQRNYDTTPDDAGFNRDSDGWRLDVGMEFRLTNVMDGEVYVGYFEQDYDDPALNDVDDVDVGGRLLWGITPMTTVRAGLARDVSETTTAGASSYLSTIVTLGVDHELMRNLLVGGNFNYANNDYQGTSRDDDIWGVGAYGKYFITRNFFTGADIGYRDRDSNLTGQSYDQWTVGAFIGAQF